MKLILTKLSYFWKLSEYTVLNSRVQVHQFDTSSKHLIFFQKC